MKNLRIMGSFLTALTLTVNIYAGGNSSKANVLPDVVMLPETYDNRYFVYLAGGVATISVDSYLETGASFYNGALDDAGNLIELGIGYRYNPHIFFTLSGQRTALDLADINNLYMSANYRFSEVMLHPYVGGIVGYSELKWSQRPHIMLYNEDLTSDGWFGGVQAGIEYWMTGHITLFGKAQYLLYDHLMDIRMKRSQIEHTDSTNILVGVRYEF